MTQVNPQAGQVTSPADLTDPARQGEPFTNPTANKVPRGRWFKEVGWRHLVGIIAIVYAVIPVLYILSASLNPAGSVSAASILPRAISFENYAALFNDPGRPFARWFLNTLIVAVVVVIVSLFCSALAAYAFSRFRFKAGAAVSSHCC